MQSSDKFQNECLQSIELLNISDISISENPIRSISKNILELADSINKIGLLIPILVRPRNSGKFEVIAGNRRLEACKTLDWKRIQCHIVELDDKSAFEVSIIENIQRNTLDIIEEGLAFKRYVEEFGWGAASDLAGKLSKSSSYVSKRMRLLELPSDILDLICQSEISISTGEELLAIKQSHVQRRFAKLVQNQEISSKKVRAMIQNEKKQMDDSGTFPYTYSDKDEVRYLKAFNNSILALRTAMNSLAKVAEKVEDNWILYEILLNHKKSIHSQIDYLIREKRKYTNKNHFFNIALYTPGKSSYDKGKK